ncbi:MAG: tetratricopeptide repeat protein [Gemmatimonadota bacterium]|nr:tetratricopeptide repeat protein [Gemmatimonadota bacterium]MDH3427471.1 tetratricopeptide repeat protein [Gemmatimonadota bacterium]
MVPIRHFFAELRRRKVIRAAGLYVLVAWMVIQVGEATFDSLDLPDWSLRLVIVLAALGFPLVLVLAWAYDLQPARDRKILRTPPTDRSPIESIAVLPFADMSPDGDQAYFADGIAEELLNTLTNCCRHLRVAARSSSFVYKGVDTDAREIGARLGVDALVEGSVRKSGDTVRITVQLIDVRDGYHIWSESYDRQLVDLFAVQDEIAHSVVDALDLSLTDHDRSAIAGSPPADVRAYEFYLKGRQFFHQSRKRSLAYAQDMYRSAIDVDPAYALAWAGLAASAALSAMLYPGAPSADKDIAQADAASARALELDPSLADAHAARGFALFLMQSYEEAEAAFEKAIELDPQQFDAHLFYGRTCFQQGRFEDAARLFTAAAKIRQDHEAEFFAAQALEASGRTEEAKTHYRASLEASAEHMKLNPDDSRAATFRAVSNGRLGNSEEGFRWAEQALAIDPTDAVVMYNVACFYAVEGESDRAIDILERAADAGFNRGGWLEHDPDLDSLRDDGRFKALLQSS